MLLKVNLITPLFWTTSCPPSDCKAQKAHHQEICLVNLLILDWTERGWFDDIAVGIRVHVAVIVVVLVVGKKQFYQLGKDNYSVREVNNSVCCAAFLSVKNCDRQHSTFFWSFPVLRERVFFFRWFALLGP